MQESATRNPSYPDPPSLLGGLSIDAFLRDYWQQKPLLIRNAWPNIEPPVTPEQLAGLACEPEVESRLVLERDGAYPWQVKNGPFPEDEFNRLPPSHWSLLVQRADRHVPAAAAILKHFQFVPAWRIDDLMISYAPEQSSVGAHIDNYDVFLLQGMGRREWHINEHDYSMDDFVPNMDLKLLPDFEPNASWILETGDMLYLPPGVAHHGIALNNCMTLSIGFRAPSRLELLSAYADDCLIAGSDRRYRDPGLMPCKYSHELSSVTRAGLRQLLRESLADDDTVDRWLGCYLTRVETEPLPLPCEPPLELEIFRASCQRHGELVRNLDARFMFQMMDGGAILYANGESYSVSDSQTAIWIAENDVLDVTGVDNLPSDITELLLTLFNRGLLDFEGENDD